MATNLVSLIMQSVTPTMISKMASALGLDREDAQKAVGVSIPAILAAFANMASKPGGGQQLSNALQQQGGILEQAKAALSGGGDGKALADSGTSLLSSLLGGGAVSSLAGIVGRFAGIDAGAGKSLLGMLAPVVAGVIGQQQRSAGLDAKGLASLLTSQKDQIAAAMPSGFANMLNSTGLLDNLGDTWRHGSATASAAADRVSEMSDYATAGVGQAARSARMGTWPYVAASLVALGLLGWYFLGQNTQQVAEGPATTPPQTTTTGAGVPDIKLTDLTADLTSSVSVVRSALQGMTDPASVQASLPKLQQATERLGNIGNAMSQLPPDARRGLSSFVERSMPILNQLCDKVLATPQTAALAKPAIDTLRARLNELSRS